MVDSIHFNTSLVTVYHRISDQGWCGRTDFNTSHVTVYQHADHNNINRTCISIHLMLLFIPARWGVYVGEMIFQYISCYCLSEWLVTMPLDDWNFNTSHVTVYLPSCSSSLSYGLISIHLMLLFIASDSRKILRCSNISIHLMLLFIKAAKAGTSSEASFQYISCYCLSTYKTV